MITFGVLSNATNLRKMRCKWVTLKRLILKFILLGTLARYTLIVYGLAKGFCIDLFPKYVVPCNGLKGVHMTQGWSQDIVDMVTWYKGILFLAKLLQGFSSNEA